MASTDSRDHYRSDTPSHTRTKAGAHTHSDTCSNTRTYAQTDTKLQYDVDCETSLATHYCDVFKTIYSTKKEAGIRHSSLPFWLSRSKNDEDSENKLGGNMSGGP
jgi:hypothetical protein